MMILLLVSIGGIIFSCKKSDNVPPIITMNGADTVYQVLNEVYSDAGATATDENDGNLTSNIYIDNQVDEDRVGVYNVTYSVVDKDGNEAPERVRTVFVYNTGLEYYGQYQAREFQVFYPQDTCKYTTYVWIDSTVNNRIVFLDFACNSNRVAYADINDTLLVMPYQVIQDSIVNMTLQGSGTINDSLIFLDYKKTDTLETTYWNAYLYFEFR